MTATEANGVRTELGSLRQWTVWGHARDGRKLILSPNHPGRNASTSDPATWSDLETAQAVAAERGLEGVAFVITEGDEYVGGDLDLCVKDGQLHPAAAEIVFERLGGTYAEFSTSKTGVHFIGKGDLGLPPGSYGRKITGASVPWHGYVADDGHEEAEFQLFTKHFLIFTWQPLNGNGIEECQFDALLSEYFEGLDATKQNGALAGAFFDFPDTDDELLAYAKASPVTGARFAKLYDEGDTGDHPSASEAEQALCNLLAYLTADAERINRLVERSALMSEKWRATRRDNTIKKAIQRSSRPLLPNPEDPMKVARAVAKSRYRHSTGETTLRRWREDWWRWDVTRWVEVERAAVRAEMYEFTERAVYEKWSDGKARPYPWIPNRNKIANLLEAFAAVTHLDEMTPQPGWLDGRELVGPFVSCANGLLDVGERKLLPHTPKFFSLTAVPFDYDADAPEPERWLSFVATLWPDEQDSIAALQEFFGYVISGRLDLQKILLLIGPPRSGKGAIARVLTALVGTENVAGPTLNGLVTNFGLQPLLGKPLAVISDARLNERNSNEIVERLLSISGEDAITVDRKNKEQWTGKLPTRFMVISNELPRFQDASAAIAGRFITLQLLESWLGKEDITLEPELHGELAGILNWSLEGLDRLAETNRFTEPESSREAFVRLQELASPVAAFVRDCCDVGPQYEVEIDAMWKEWQRWRNENGVARFGSKQLFGQNLHSAYPGIKRGQLRASADKRIPIYRGIRLKERPPVIERTSETSVRIR